MRKGNGLPFNGHDYGILFCGTDGSLLLDRAGYEITPDKVVLPYGIKLVQGDRPLRKIDLEAEKVKAKERRPDRPHIDNFLECLASREKPIADIEIGHHSTNTCHLGNIAYKLGRKLTGTRRPRPSRATRGQRAADPRVPQGLRAAGRSDLSAASHKVSNIHGLRVHFKRGRHSFANRT